MKNNTIGTACKITTGKLDSNHSVVNGCYPFYTCAENPDRIDSFAFDEDAVLVAGNNARGNFHVNRYKGKFNAYQRTYVLTAKEGFDIDYIYYALKLELKRLKEKAQGSQTKFLTMPILTDIHLQDIEHNEQEKIAKVLAKLDAKIELNNRINAELEAMAKTLFDYWFVQFDFPDADGKPYKTSGGKMVYNLALKREIPKGWEVKPLLKSCEVIDCLHSKKPNYCFEKEELYLLQLENILDNGQISISNKYHVSKEDYETWTSRIEVKKHDIVMTNAGRIAAFAQVPNYVKCGIGRNITAIRPFGLKPNYFFLSLYGLDIQRQILTSLDHGAFFKSFNVKGIKGLQLLHPLVEIENSFDSIVEPIIAKRHELLAENTKLIELRDWLLPMLMNGQVTVK